MKLYNIPALIYRERTDAGCRLIRQEDRIEQEPVI